jgi:acetyl esterase/lipase
VHKHKGLSLLVNRAVMKTTPTADPDAFERASPIACIHPDAPPFFVVHGDQDSMAPHEEARVFVKALRETSRSKVAYAELQSAGPRTERSPGDDYIDCALVDRADLWAVPLA